ncbi:phosphatidylinositol-glycan biosynthesis class W protein-like [Mercenaria mercenaria]|uniref:phosphatidylinositol-glycan biosynthesis class W protein-like n=1 Tax=Mercenaria mercenaria TaxID=6596 RepID=UPI00234E428A|nr:phosphatidylinositol-glycan biosynthesis class W protein-like [Mercenaria mercenaria]
MTYKEEHEAFVSGTKGTNVLHIAVTGIACLLPVYIRDVCVAAVPGLAKFKENLWLGLLLDFIAVIVPLQFTMSVFSENSFQCLFIFFMSFALIFNIKMRQKAIRSVREKVTLTDVKMGNRRPFITYYRAYANVITAFSILAVDFKIFPRYFAKAETYGTGLMDVGVGGFLITNAVVSPEARGIIATDRVVPSVLKSLKSSIPLIVIGMVRVLAVKSTDYQEHVTEYGVHWNFFFTLAAVKVGCTLLFCTVSPRLWNIAAVLIIAIYQHNLTYGDLKNYIINGADGKGGRTDLIDANREGLYSCIGLFSIYIMGVQLGKLVMRKRENVKDWMKLCFALALVSIVCWVLMYFTGKHVEPVSRRFANLAYLLWMVAFNSMLMFAFLVFDIAVTCLSHLCRIAKKKESPDHKPETDTATPGDDYNTCDLISAINYNGLFYFLLANLLTGLVNMSVKTIYQSNLVAMTILTGYMFLLSSVLYFLYRKKISLKIW